MKILGIDPGPNGIAWAIFDSGINGGRGDIVEWGEDPNWGTRRNLTDWNYASIEWPQIHPKQTGNALRDTIATAGLWWGRLGQNTILLSRDTIKTALLGVKRGRGRELDGSYGDPEVNKFMAKLCPALNGKAPGLNSHTRAAAAVAYVAAGRIPLTLGEPK